MKLMPIVESINQDLNVYVIAGTILFREEQILKPVELNHADAIIKKLALRFFLNQLAEKKYNTYDLTGEYGIGYTLKGELFYFDLEDYDKIKDICWYMNSKGYLVGYNLDNSKTIKMHRYIMGLTENDSQVVDHINSTRKMDN